MFDFDGTLVDSNRIKRDMFFQIAERQIGGRDIMEEVHGRVRGSRSEIWRAWASQIGADASFADQMVANYTAIVDDAVAKAPEMPGAVALLQALRAKGLKLMVSSSTPSASLTPIIKARCWQGYFDAIYGHPETKVEILTRYAVPLAGSPERVAVVGDGGDDRESARVIGCRFFPVGEARGAPPSSSEHLYSLPELANLLGLQSHRKMVL